MMNILTDQELRARKRLAFTLGALFAAAVSALIYHQLYERLLAPAGAPEIVMQAGSQTVARIPTQYAGKRIDCIVVIDQAKNVWKITC